MSKGNDTIDNQIHRLAIVLDTIKKTVVGVSNYSDIASRLLYKRVGTISDYKNPDKYDPDRFKSFLARLQTVFNVNPDYVFGNSEDVFVAPPDGLKTEQSTSEPSNNYHTARMERKGQKRLTQFYDAPATASDVDSDMVPVTQPAGYIDTGELFGQCEAAIRIRGNSMLAGYPSGTILGLNRDYDTFFEPGELYVLETRSKRLFKRLFYHPDDLNIIICHSDNEDRFSKGERAGSPFYPDFPVHMSDVVRRFIVVGSAREHSNSILLYANPIKDANAQDEIHVLAD